MAPLRCQAGSLGCLSFSQMGRWAISRLGHWAASQLGHLTVGPSLTSLFKEFKFSF
ncbi:hypothetical protein NXF25_019136 [Crotalus adamanteus]|uniref:Uncharacterized protein n=1 Tax=Crotalus adamanteus TaxID=8729 RepID=A0AAW1B1C7_CROAD